MCKKVLPALSCTYSWHLTRRHFVPFIIYIHALGDFLNIFLLDCICCGLYCVQKLWSSLLLVIWWCVFWTGVKEFWIGMCDSCCGAFARLTVLRPDTDSVAVLPQPVCKRQQHCLCSLCRRCFPSSTIAWPPEVSVYQTTLDIADGMSVVKLQAELTKSKTNESHHSCAHVNIFAVVHATGEKVKGHCCLSLCLWLARCLWLCSCWLMIFVGLISVILVWKGERVRCLVLLGFALCSKLTGRWNPVTD